MHFIIIIKSEHMIPVILLPGNIAQKVVPFNTVEDDTERQLCRIGLDTVFDLSSDHTHYLLVLCCVSSAKFEN